MLAHKKIVWNRSRHDGGEHKAIWSVLPLVLPRIHGGHRPSCLQGSTMTLISMICRADGGVTAAAGWVEEGGTGAPPSSKSPATKRCMAPSQDTHHACPCCLGVGERRRGPWGPRRCSREGAVVWMVKVHRGGHREGKGRRRGRCCRRCRIVVRGR